MAEIAEEIEQAAHHHHGAVDEDQRALSRRIGLTMAVLGVMVAVCAALVGGARTELLSTLVEQTQISQKGQTASQKHRMLEAQLQQLHALLPTDEGQFKASQAKVEKIQGSIKGADEKKLAELDGLLSGQILNTVTPTKSDLLRFVQLTRRVNQQKEGAYQWAQSFDDSIKAYTKAVEHYEWGQLCAEVAIILCSVALLLSMRFLWIGGLVLGVLCMGLSGMTWATVHHELERAEVKIHHAEEHYREFNTDKEDREYDEKLLLDVEKYAGP